MRAAGPGAVGLLVLAVLVVGPAPAAAQDRDDEDPWWGRDKALHFGVSGMIAAGGYALSVPLLDEPWQRAAAGGGLALLAGVGKEVWDAIGDGDPSWRDMTWNLVGSAAGLLLAVSVDLLVRALRGPPEPGDAAAAPEPLMALRF